MSPPRLRLREASDQQFRIAFGIPREGGFWEAICDLDEQLMPDQHGFGDNGTDSARRRQSGQGDDQMNEYDSEVAHPGNGINILQTTTLKPVWQFAIDRYSGDC